MTGRLGLVWVVTLSALFGLFSQVSAIAPQTKRADVGRQRVGLSSTWVDCLTVRPGESRALSAAVKLAWQGQVDEAYLVFTASGSQSGHSIYVNGQFVGRAPARAGEQACTAGSRTPIPLPADSLRIPVDVLARGENTITLTNDAGADDGWSTVNMHIEIHGLISGPPVAALDAPVPTAFVADVQAGAVVSSSVILTSSYELALGQTITQVVYYQIPTSYTAGVSTPLVIGVHGYGDTGLGMLNTLAAEANNRGWLLAAPDMHGNYFKNHGRYALGWVGAQHDIVDTIEHMIANYSVDKSRIYIIGASMGGQIATLMDAKYPDLFAAGVEWSGITDLASWYDTLISLGLTSSPWIPNIRREIDPTCNLSGAPEIGCGSPVAEPFEYQRRSSVTMPQNARLVPLKIWHDQGDQLVPIQHSRNLRDGINAWGPPTPVSLIEVNTNPCPGFYNHCYDPAPQDMYAYLADFTLSAAPPLSVTVRSDESKPYYWLNVVHTSDVHWAELNAVYNPALRSVTVVVSETQPMTLGINLGVTPISGPGGVARPGLGLPAGYYRAQGGGVDNVYSYASGYLTVTLTATGQYTLTISPGKTVFLPMVVKN